MPSDAIVSLEQLRCLTLKNTESRTEPYIWPALLRIDDNTLATEPNLMVLSAPLLGSARVVIKDSMRAGEVAAIPGSVGLLRTRFEDNLETRRLVLVVALFENDETPESAVRDGFRAFKDELPLAISERLFDLVAADEAEDEEESDRITGEIRKRLEDRVRSAIRNGLSGFEKAKVLAGILNLDDPAGSTFKSFGKGGLGPTAITLTFEAKRRLLGQLESVSKFEIQGQLLLRRVIIDRCKSRVEAVNDAQSIVNGIQQEIESLQDQLQGQGDGPDLPKPFILQEIRRLREEELGPALEALEDARAALKACRDLPVLTQETRAGGVITR